MPPKARSVIVRASEEFGVPMADLIGPRKRRTKKAIAARYAVIRELYDPSTVGCVTADSYRKWGASAIARVLQCDHTTVIFAARKMGLRP